MSEEESIKLFVGQVPRDWSEKNLREVFEKYGEISSLKLITDRETGRPKGCAFLTYKDKESAKHAQEELHEKKTLPGARSAIQVKPAESEKDENRKLYVGNVSRRCDEEQISNMFSRYGSVEDISILKNADGKSRGSAFVKFKTRQQAQKAIKGLHESETMPGCRFPLIVKVADTEKDKFERRKMHQNQYQHQDPYQHGSYNQQQQGASYNQQQQQAAPYNQQQHQTPYNQQQASYQQGASNIPSVGLQAHGVPAVGSASVLAGGQSQLQQQLLAQIAYPQLLAGGHSIIAAGPGVLPSSLGALIANMQQQQIQPLQPANQAQSGDAYSAALQGSYIIPQANGLSGLTGIGTLQNPLALGVQSQYGGTQLGTSAQMGTLQNQLPGSAQNPASALQYPLGSTLGGTLQNALGGTLQNQLGSAVQNPLGGSLQTHLNGTLQNQLTASVQSPLAGSLHNQLGSSIQNTLGTSTGAANAYGIGSIGGYATLGTGAGALGSTGLVDNTLQQAYTGGQSYITPISQSYSANTRPSSGLQQQQPQQGSIKKEGQGPEGANLFIYQVPPEFTDTDLINSFAPYGNIVSAKIFVDKNTGASKGFGFVSYDNANSANTAINAMNGVTIGSRRLRVQHKRPKEQGRPY